MFSQLSQCTGLNPQEVESFFFHTPLRELYEKGQIDTIELYRRFLARSPRPFSLADFKMAYSHIFTPNTALFSQIELLKSQKTRLILLSNTSECHFDYLQHHYPILHRFDSKILSFQIGAWKPEKAIFERALKEAHCAPHECYYLDDLPENIAQAAQCGLPGQVYIKNTTR